MGNTLATNTVMLMQFLNLETVSLSLCFTLLYLYFCLFLLLSFVCFFLGESVSFTCNFASSSVNETEGKKQCQNSAFS